jgi:iron complex outermembrane recepter protein
VRTSYGTSFKAPALPQLFDAAALTATTLPGPGGTRILSLYRYGGNPDLSPETATTWSAGLDYAPEGGWRISLGYFDTAFTDRIAQPVNENLNGALIDPTLAPFVQRVSPAANPEDLALIQDLIATPGFPAAGLYPPTAYGAVLDGRWVNAASVDVRGLDGAILAPLRFDDHEIVLDASAAYLLDYRVRTTATAPERSVVGRVGYPVRLRARAGGVWTRGDVSVAAHWNHVAAYEDGAGRAIEAWNTIDAQLAWRRADGLRLSLSVQNLLDADPPLYDSVNGLGFDPGQANVLGRVISLQLIQRW